MTPEPVTRTCYLCAHVALGRGGGEADWESCEPQTALGTSQFCSRHSLPRGSSFMDGSFTFLFVVCVMSLLMVFANTVQISGFLWLCSNPLCNSALHGHPASRSCSKDCLSTAFALNSTYRLKLKS